MPPITGTMKYDIASARPLLARTPSVLRAMLQDLPPEWLDAPEGPGAWSPREVACHMADLEHDAWLGRARAILEHGSERPLPGVDRERFRSRYAHASITQVLDDFERTRATNLDTILGMRLDTDALRSTGRHPDLGEVRLSQLLSTWVVHDLTHLAQINRAMAAQYRGEVGPWVDFLSVLRNRDQTPA